MNQIMINIGHNNMVAANQVVAIINPNSAPSRRLKDEAKEKNRLVDASQGHRTRSIIITSSNHVILTSVEAKTLSTRFGGLPIADKPTGKLAGKASKDDEIEDETL
jgi:regulator of extracellular matrix RemA (YlzA/DUF370 family)